MCIDSITDEKGLDIYTKVNIKYQRSFATIKTGVGVKTEGQLVVSGTKGYIVAWSNECFELWFLLHFHYYCTDLMLHRHHGGL